MAISLVNSGTFGFADGNGGHICNLGSAPAVGNLDVLCVNSDTVVSPPSGFTAATSRVANQGAYLFYRFAAGGEGSTVSVVTTGNFDTQVSWSRWSFAAAFDVAANAGVDATAGSSTPAVSTGALAGTGELVVAFGAIHGAVTTAPSWSTGYTPLTSITQGTGASASTGYVAYRTDAGTAAEAPSVSWTSPAPDRFILAAAFTAVTVFQKTASDTVTAVDAAALNVGVTAADTAGGVETVAVGATLSAADTGTGLEASALSVAVADADTAAGADTAALAAALSAADTATAADAAMSLDASSQRAARGTPTLAATGSQVSTR